MAETAAATPAAYYDTLPPDAISEELAPAIEELGLADNCRQLSMEGWTVVEDVADREFNHAFRRKILALAGNPGGANMLLAKEPDLRPGDLEPKAPCDGRVLPSDAAS